MMQLLPPHVKVRNGSKRGYRMQAKESEKEREQNEFLLKKSDTETVNVFIKP